MQTANVLQRNTQRVKAISSNVLHRRTVAIFGSKKGSKGAGLISSLNGAPDNDGRHGMTERLKKAAQLALGRWRSAKPDWNFKLVEIPKRKDGHVGADYAGIDALYAMDLNA